MEHAQTQVLHSRIAVREFVRQCVDIPKFYRYCQQCPSFGRTWSCPPFGFSAESVWQRYQTLWLYGEKVPVPEELQQQHFTGGALESESAALLQPVKDRILTHLLSLEAQHPGSMVLSAGSCRLCAGGCARPLGQPCRQPEQMRHSIESLGGDVGWAVSLYLGEELAWGRAGRMPPHYLLLGGLLTDPVEVPAEDGEG